MSAERDRVPCAASVPAADVAAWALDGEPAEGIDLAAHVPGCDACSRVVADLSAATDVADALRGDTTTAPEAVTVRAVGRVRAEATLVTVLRALGGGWLRVVQAAPDYLRADRPDDDLADTGEFPPIG